MLKIKSWSRTLEREKPKEIYRRTKGVFRDEQEGPVDFYITTYKNNGREESILTFQNCDLSDEKASQIFAKIKAKIKMKRIVSSEEDYRDQLYVLSRGHERYKTYCNSYFEKACLLVEKTINKKTNLELRHELQQTWDFLKPNLKAEPFFFYAARGFWDSYTSNPYCTVPDLSQKLTRFFRKLRSAKFKVRAAKFEIGYGSIFYDETINFFTDESTLFSFYLKIDLK